MKKSLLLILFFIGAVTFGFGLDDARLLRMPDINDDIVVFVYAGDIWTVNSKGGDARQLTSHRGMELFPKISPDKKWVAFSGEYSGTRQVFVVPAKGGTPKQLTYYNDVGVLPPRGGYDNVVLDWTPDSKHIMIRANRTPYGERNGKYFLVPINGGLEAPLAIPEAGMGSFSPDGNKIVYTPICREFRTWKRTLGGRAQDVWTYDLKNSTSKRITKFPGTDHQPRWYKNKLYFVSDRELTLNFFSYDLGTEKIEKITNHKPYDVLWPSGHNNLVAYENGGYIYKLDLDTGKTEKLTVNLHFDNPNILPYHKNVKNFVSPFGYGISPTGKRAVFDARGDIFTVPRKNGVTYNLTRTPGTREMFPQWSPDGRWIAYYSDKTGDYELYLLDPKGEKKPVQLTDNHKVWKFAPLWSPDSKKIMIYDRSRVLQYIDVATKKITVVDKAIYGDTGSMNWSHDSQWIVFTRSGKSTLNSIMVYSLKDKKTSEIIDNAFPNFSPAFSPCGKYIFFLSLRDLNMNFSDFEFDYVYNKAMRIYAVSLTKDAPKLFPDKNDVEAVKENKPTVKKGKASKKEGKKKTTPAKVAKVAKVKIDFRNIAHRITPMPFGPGTYTLVGVLKGKVLYVEGNGELKYFDFESKKSTSILKGVTGCELSADKKSVLYRSGRSYGITGIKPGGKPGEGMLKMDDVSMEIHPRLEWKQIFNESWRIYRDWFYVENMHGVDWKAMHKKYTPLLDHLGHRADLDFILGELIGEMNVGHAYVNWGDFERVKRIPTGLLGAEFKADKKSGRYIISKIYRGQNWNAATRSPLTTADVEINEGDYLIGLNGYDVTIKNNPYKFLVNTVGKRVKITVNATPGKAGARTGTVKPIASEQELFYLDWVESRRALVDRLSNGRIAYIHVPNTAIEGNREFFKGMYAYSHKEAFIIDDRYNGGGWTPRKMIGKLSQSVYSFWKRRGLELRAAPSFVLDGPKAMLINHYSSSGGDNFPYWFKKSKLGKLIGTRTWGGLVGYSYTPRVIDGARLVVPMTGITGLDGEFVVEGVGVYPDKGFEVYDRSEEIAKGNDPSIELAVKHLLEELKKKPRKTPKKPKGPDRSKWFEKEIK